MIKKNFTLFLYQSIIVLFILSIFRLSFLAYYWPKFQGAEFS
ncbi:MAG: hypothetical protein ACI86H_002039, partial [bacterium]